MVSIKVVTLGHMPAELDLKLISSWKSDVFSVGSDIEKFTINTDSDGYNWEFSDLNIENHLPENFEEDFLIAIVSVPLEENWYSRRLSKNRVVFSFHEIKEILQYNNVPIENIIYRLFYAYTLLYKRSRNKIPLNSDNTNFTHDETRGCLFDMNGIKTDIIHSCHTPIICDDCTQRLRNETVSDNIITKAKKEIKKIKKPLFFRISEFIKRHPILSLLISAIIALVLGTISSLLASFISS